MGLAGLMFIVPAIGLFVTAWFARADEGPAMVIALAALLLFIPPASMIVGFGFLGAAGFLVTAAATPLAALISALAARQISDIKLRRRAYFAAAAVIALPVLVALVSAVFLMI